MFITIDGAQIFFDVTGPGLAERGGKAHARPALLALHGGPGFDHYGLRSFFDRFAGRFQVFYLDHRGNGRSRGGRSSDPSLWNLARWGDDIAAFCNALGLERPIVFGQSFGGMVAQSYATRHPGHAAAVVFSSTAARMRMEWVLDAFEKLGGAETRAVAARFWSQGRDEDIAEYQRICMPLYNYVSRPPAPVLHRNDVYRHFSLPGGEIWRMDFRAALAKTASPALVLTGTRDPVTPAERARDIFDALPEALRRYAELPETGHGTFRDKPDETERLLNDFFDEALGV